MESLTFLFADVVGSEDLWDADARAMAAAVERYDAIVAQVLVDHNGSAVRPRGEGDGRFLVFPSAVAATTGALAAARQLLVADWPTSCPLAIRMALVTGTATWRQGDYYGSDVNKAARLRAAAHGGQVLLSRRTAEEAGEGLAEGADVRDLGLHRLKDLSAPERIFQLVHPDLPCEFPPLRTLDLRRHNLPVAVTDLLERPSDTAEVASLLERSRCVAVLGPAGCGKTRLALHAAAQAVERYCDGVWLMNRNLVGDPGSIVGIAGLRKLEDLSGLELLIVLDGCEDAPSAAAHTVRRLLEVGPKVHVLATSREPLEVSSAVTWTLGGLDVPPVDGSLAVSAVGAYPAVQLFVQRAQAARADFVLTDANAPAVAEVCRLLDGNPRALEDAAVRLRSSQPNELAARLRRSASRAPR